ncbi:hypothetical protein [Ruixingdingia sedimenti]|uniref:Uncharacterized protein n=1 Tax=Ruixingdingia sedimenti TaxID=3073604 RepID=A0ABU1F8Y6_9RHOB|nr:hypothetical protein [Xinfangfangia sp. LG-4]MDR5653078.1 hypothetical protein [Xinfangfangia sp. LG-4]
MGRWIWLWAAFAAGPAGAGSFTPPAGCDGFLTVQALGCKLSNFYRCGADAPGDQWRVDFGVMGAYFISRTDHEAQWVESVDLSPPRRQSLAPDPADPASFSELLASGMDTFSFGLVRDDGTASLVDGFDRLAGQTRVIDGVPLQMTEFAFSETDADTGALLHRARGREYVHSEWRLFFAGPSEWDVGEGFQPIDHSPVEFVFPGEPGFFATEPKYGCGMMMSQAPARIIPARAMSADPKE